MPRRDRRRVGDPIKVAFLNPTLEAGGAERQMLILAQTLPKESFEVRFLLLSGGGHLAEAAAAAGARIHLLGLERQACVPLRPRCLAAAARAARRYKALTADVDIVDAWLTPSMIFAAVNQPLARVPVLIGGRRNLVDLYRDKSWPRRAAARAAAGRMHAIVANSRVAAREAVEVDGIDPARVRVIPNAVLPAVTDTDRDAVRAAWGHAADDLVVGCVANYKTEKGLIDLLRAAASIRDRLPTLRYVLVGEGPLRGRLEADIDRLGLRSVVRLHGAEGDARRLYAGFDLFVQSSLTEGLPNAVLEAAAAGLPIVATAVGGTTEILTADRDGILVRRGDPSALAGAIGRLAEDADLRRRLGAAARERATDYSPARLAGATAELYRRLARPGDSVPAG